MTWSRYTRNEIVRQISVETYGKLDSMLSTEGMLRKMLRQVMETNIIFDSALKKILWCTTDPREDQTKCLMHDSEGMADIAREAFDEESKLNREQQV